LVRLGYIGLNCVVGERTEKFQQTSQPGDAFEDTAFKLGFEIVNF
jgi:hypothetical protein